MTSTHKRPTMKKNILIGSIFSALFLITTSHANESTRLGETPSELTKRWREGERGKTMRASLPSNGKRRSIISPSSLLPKSIYAGKLLSKRGGITTYWKKKKPYSLFSNSVKASGSQRTNTIGKINIQLNLLTLSLNILIGIGLKREHNSVNWLLQTLA